MATETKTPPIIPRFDEAQSLESTEALQNSSLFRNETVEPEVDINTALQNTELLPQPTIQADEPLVTQVSSVKNRFALSSFTDDSLFDDETLLEQTIIDRDKANKTLDDQFSAQQKLLDLDPNTATQEEVDRILEETRTAITEPRKARTFGTIYLEKNFPGLQEPGKSVLSAALDIRFLHEKDQQIQAQILNAKDMNEVVTRPLGLAIVVSPELEKHIREHGNRDSVIKLPGIRPGMPDKTDVDALEQNTTLDVLKDFEASKRDVFGEFMSRRIMFPSLNRNKFPIVSGDVGADTGITVAQINTVGDALSFMNLVSTDGSEDFDFSFLANLILEGNADLAGREFGRVAEEKYGKNWEWRMAAFALKEVGVDAALLVAAILIPPLAPLVMAGKGATLARRFRAVIGRATLFGVGGGSVQVGLNAATGQPLDTGEEIAIRFGASLVGDAAFKVGAVAFRQLGKGKRIPKGTDGTPGKALDDASTAVAEATGKTKVATVIKEAAKQPGPNVPEMARSLQIASFVSTLFESAEVRRLAATVSKGLINDQTQEARVQLAKLIGLPEATMDLVIIDARNMFTELTGRTISKSTKATRAAGQTRLKALPEQRGAVTAARSAKTELDKTITKATEKLERVGKRPTSRKEKVIKKREATAKALRKEIRIAKKELKVAETTLETETKKLTESEEAIKVLGGSSTAEAVAAGDAIGFRVLIEDRLGLVGQKVNEIFESRITALGTHSFRPITLKETSAFMSSWTSLFRLVGEPEMLFRVGGVAEELMQAWNRKNAFRVGYREMFKEATRGLNRKDMAPVWATLEKGSELEKVFTYDDLIQPGLGLNSKQAATYFNIRKILDFGHLTLDSVITREMQRKGLKEMADGQIVQVFTEGLTKQDIKAGMVRFKSIRRSGTDVPEEGVVSLASLREVQSAVRVQKGYIPRTYKDAHYHVSVINKKRGTYSRIGAFATRAEARKFKEAKVAESKSENLIFYHDKWDQLLQNGTMWGDRAFVNFMDVADDAAIKGVQRALTEANVQGFDTNAMRVVFDRLDQTSLKRRFVGERGAEGLAGTGPGGKAPTLLAEQAIPDYMENVAFRQGMSDWRDWAITKFKEVYGLNGTRAVFTNRSQRWDSPIADDGNTNALIVREAKQFQKWLKFQIRQKTTHEEYFDNALNAKIAAWEGSKNSSGKVMTKILGSKVATAIPFRGTAKSFINPAKIITSASKLLFFNPAQLIVQGSQSVVSIGTKLASNPKVVFPALMDVANAAQIAGRKQSGLKISVAEQKVLTPYENSGYLSDLGTTDLVPMGGVGGRPVYSRLREQQKAMDAGFEAAVSAFKRGVQGFYNVGSIFFKAGEGANRAIAFSVVRKDFISRINRAAPLGNINLKMPSTGKPMVKADIDTPEFLAAVVEIAKETALNMTKPGQLEAMAGLGSVLLQFKQVLPKAVNVFLTNKLTTVEKFGAAAGYLGVFGVTAIPLLADFWAAADYLVWLATAQNPNKREMITEFSNRTWKSMLTYVAGSDDAELSFLGIQRKDWDRLVKKGALNALTDGEIDIVNRVGLGRFVSDMADNLGPEEFIVFLGVVDDILDSDQGVASIYSVLEKWHQDVLTTPQAIQEVAARLGTVISTSGYISRYLKNIDQETFDPTYTPYNAKTIKSRGNRDTGVPLEGEGSFLARNRVFQFLVGLTPGPVVNKLELQQQENRIARAVKTYMSRQIDRFSSEITAKGRMQIRIDTMIQLRLVNQFVQNKGFFIAPFNQENWMNRFEALLNSRFQDKLIHRER